MNRKIAVPFIVVLLSAKAFAQAPAAAPFSGYQETDVYHNLKPASNSNARPVIYLSDSAGNSISAYKPGLTSLTYAQLTQKADSLFAKKEFAEAARLYFIAFKNNADRGLVKHRYNSACCYAQMKEPGNAFTQLYRIAEKGNYYNYIEMEGERYLNALHTDARWPVVIKIIKANAARMEQQLSDEIPGNRN